MAKQKQSKLKGGIRASVRERAHARHEFGVKIEPLLLSRSIRKHNNPLRETTISIVLMDTLLKAVFLQIELV